MLSMTEKTLVGLVVTLAVVFTAIVVLPVWTYEARLSTSPSSSNISAPLGRPFNVTCQGESNVNGIFKNMKWLNPKGDEISRGTKQVGKNTLLLTIEDPKETDSGVYKCLAVYENENMEIHLSVKFYGPRPEFEIDYETVEVEEGEKVELWCQATGDLPLTYEWFDQKGDKISAELNSTIQVYTSVNGSSLIIDKIEFDHDGEYMCTASNSHGLSNKLYELRVTPSDGNETALIRNVRAIQITATSVRFSLSVSKAVTMIEVKYAESRYINPNYTTFIKGAVYEIDGLIPGGKYSFEFRPLNASRSLPYSYTVILLPSKPDVIFQSLTGDSLKIQWERTFDEIMRGTTDKFQLRYYTIRRISGNSWSNGSCAITIELPSCASPRYTIAGLSKNVYYVIELRAHTVSGFGEAYKAKLFMKE